MPCFEQYRNGPDNIAGPSIGSGRCSVNIQKDTVAHPVWQSGQGVYVMSLVELHPNVRGSNRGASFISSFVHS